MEARASRREAAGRERVEPLAAPKLNSNGSERQGSRYRARGKPRAHKWRVFAAAMRQNAEACFVAACSTEGEAAALSCTLDRRYRAARFWISRVDLTTRPGAWAELKQRLEPKPKRAPKSATQRLEAQARALEPAKPSAAVLLAMAAKERRLAADALKLAMEKRRQAERAARLEVDRRAKAAVAVARGAP